MLFVLVHMWIIYAGPLPLAVRQLYGAASKRQSPGYSRSGLPAHLHVADAYGVKKVPGDRALLIDCHARNQQLLRDPLLGIPPY